MTNNDSTIQKFDEHNCEPQMVSMVRQELNIGDINVNAFMDANGLYYININQAGKLIDKGANAVNDYIISKLVAGSFGNLGKMSYQDARTAISKGLNQSVIPIFNVNSNDIKYRVIPIDTLYHFIRYWDKKGNRKASDLIDAFGKESLLIRCEAAFVGVSPNVLDIHHATNEWLSSRQANKSVHGAFAQYCVEAKLPGRHIHDLMTTHVFGQTKRQAIACNKLVGENATVGLDYQDSVEGQLIMAKLKVKFMSYRKGSWRERVDRCFLESI